MSGKVSLQLLTISALLVMVTETPRAQVQTDLAVLVRGQADARKSTSTKVDRRPVGLKSAALGILKLYQVVLSPQDAPVCNFTVSCSRFAARAIEEHGLLHGTAMAADRILRCNGLGSRHYEIHPDLLLAIDLPIERYRLGRTER